MNPALVKYRQNNWPLWELVFPSEVVIVTVAFASTVLENKITWVPSKKGGVITNNGAKDGRVGRLCNLNNYMRQFRFGILMTQSPFSEPNKNLASIKESLLYWNKSSRKWPPPTKNNCHFLPWQCCKKTWKLCCENIDSGKMISRCKRTINGSCLSLMGKMFEAFSGETQKLLGLFDFII